jgi:hypothetical protein
MTGEAHELECIRAYCCQLTSGCIQIIQLVAFSLNTTLCQDGFDAPNLIAGPITYVKGPGLQSAFACTLRDVCRGTPDPKDESLAAHLMRVRDEQGKLLPHARQWSELSVFFYAGMETTAHTIAWYASLGWCCEQLVGCQMSSRHAVVMLMTALCARYNEAGLCDQQ